MPNNAIICIVDDDDDVRDSLRILLESADFSVRDYASAAAFLNDDVAVMDCVVADVHMPGMSGLELQEEVARRRRDLPVVFVSGIAEVRDAVHAMKAGAIDFIEKPLDPNNFLATIRRALAISEHERNQSAQTKLARRLIGTLTPRETDVLDKLVDGLSNKAVAQALGISPRTVEVYRAQIMVKLKASGLSDTVRIALTARTDARP